MVCAHGSVIIDTLRPPLRSGSLRLLLASSDEEHGADDDGDGDIGDLAGEDGVAEPDPAVHGAVDQEEGEEDPWCAGLFAAPDEADAGGEADGGDEANCEAEHVKLAIKVECCTQPLQNTRSILFQNAALL